MARGARGRGRPRGRGRGRVPAVAESVAQSATVERVAYSHVYQEGRESEAGLSAGVAGIPAGTAGIAAGVARAQDDRIANLLTLLLERLPERVPVQAPVVPPVVEVQPRVEVAEELPSYIRLMEQLRRIGTEFFRGGANPEDADACRTRMEQNFQSIRCPERYRVDLAVHYLEGDAHLWWRGVAAMKRRWMELVADYDLEIAYHPGAVGVRGS
ncbi:unnamed protein product [Arabidopsis arenosa]|uniref:Retrotransposon gag domain-containing protein n=1 Tax=Arabidopsis arenosa TaxID=38785 RepID=A0A8S2B1E3_ARAAE|nr:unnamed protein product [Arabidopsis arenosa]